MKNYKAFLLIFILIVILMSDAIAQNPIIRDQFSADPSARVFNGKVYLYPSHDIPAPKEFARKDWFCMQDYHVFSSSNLTEHVQNKIERLEYAMADNPMGPFKVTGVIMDESPTGCWTIHQSVVEFNNQWYLFYHNNDLSPKFDKNRSVRIDCLFFNPDGTIRKVTPTFRGVGVTSALQKIEIDRYSRISETGASVAFLDTLNTFNGWETILNKQNAWIQYNTVDFGNKKPKSVQVKALSQTGGILQIRLDKADGILLAGVKIHKGTGWNTVDTRLSKYQKGIHNLVVMLKDNNPVEVDWIRFKN